MRNRVFPVWSQTLEGASSRVLARKKAPKGMSSILFADPEKATATKKPAARSFDIIDASDISFWLNTNWNFYQPETDGSERHVWSAQLTIYADQTYNLFLYVGETYGGMTQEQYTLDHISGTVQLNTDPSLWMLLAGTGDEQLVDTGNPALDTDTPLDTSFAWFVNPNSQDGSSWEFVNGDYAWPWNNFIFNRIPNPFMLAKPLAASNATLIPHANRRRS